MAAPATTATPATARPSMPAGPKVAPAPSGATVGVCVAVPLVPLVAPVGYGEIVADGYPVGGDKDGDSDPYGDSTEGVSTTEGTGEETGEVVTLTGLGRSNVRILANDLEIKHRWI